MRLFLFISTAWLLTGCAYQLSTFQYSTSNSALPNGTFYYTAYNLTGRATAAYRATSGTVVAGGDEVVNGLVSSAKMDLMRAHPLEPNEFYTNWCVDQITTEKGNRLGSYKNAKRYEVTVVVSADIAQLGNPPEGYELPMPFISAGAASEVATPLIGTSDAMPSSANPTDSLPAHSFTYALGDSVLVYFRGNRLKGAVADRMLYYGQREWYEVLMQFKSKEVSKWYFDDEMTPLETE